MGKSPIQEQMMKIKSGDAVPAIKRRESSVISAKRVNSNEPAVVLGKLA